MLTQITFYPILGIPLIAWGGLITLTLFILAAIIAILNSKGITKQPLITFKGHAFLAKIGLIFGIIHGILAFLSFI
ncbi:hypothetical protein ACFL2U_01205 [Patescibacteria group bacterium]